MTLSDEKFTDLSYAISACLKYQNSPNSDLVYSNFESFPTFLTWGLRSSIVDPKVTSICKGIGLHNLSQSHLSVESQVCHISKSV